ncbi:hypothetical protein BDV25DRAFT_148797 [Aspergillus avenaceus]|uniref:Uncharacterized protein n=1 Tax=Aspergillus avenaceus TaxID=36643 RepID=A0A5N6U5D7_ASPAV|nr:hypothetical protein BDV25DRAFT_148797 [Aspergillus avenaceus]
MNHRAVVPSTSLSQPPHHINPSTSPMTPNTKYVYCINRHSTRRFQKVFYHNHITKKTSSVE